MILLWSFAQYKFIATCDSILLSFASRCWVCTRTQDNKILRTFGMVQTMNFEYAGPSAKKRKEEVFLIIQVLSRYNIMLSIFPCNIAIVVYRLLFLIYIASCLLFASVFFSLWKSLDVLWNFETKSTRVEFTMNDDAQMLQL